MIIFRVIDRSVDVQCVRVCILLCSGGFSRTGEKETKETQLCRATDTRSGRLQLGDLDGKVIKTLVELGDGGSSRVYKGFLAEKVVAVKKLKFYSVRFASSLIAAYEGLFELSHPNVTKVLGICPKEGYIVMECCEKVVNDVTVRTLADLIRHFGTSLPIDLRITAIADIADGVHYLHENGVIHGDIKPLNVLVCGGNESDDFCFKITDYACLGNKIAAPSSSKSVTLKQLMTPAYTAPELSSEDGAYSQPTVSSDTL